MAFIRTILHLEKWGGQLLEIVNPAKHLSYTALSLYRKGFVVVLMFYSLSTLFSHFGCGHLSYPHCSWASLLGSWPVLSANSFASNWQLPVLNQWKGENDQSPRKNVAGREDPVWFVGRANHKCQIIVREHARLCRVLQNHLGSQLV